MKVEVFSTKIWSQKEKPNKQKVFCSAKQKKRFLFDGTEQNV